MKDRRYYVLMGIVAIIFCLGSLLLGADTKAVAKRSIQKQQQDLSAMNDQLRQESQPRTADDVVTAGY
jgi:hypothetical protein